MDVNINRHTIWGRSRDADIQSFLEELGDLMKKHNIQIMYQNWESPKGSLVQIKIENDQLIVKNLIIR